MQIEVKARTFFEASQGSWQERYFFSDQTDHLHQQCEFFR